MQKVWGTLDPCFITTQYSRCLQIYPGVIFYKMRHHAQVHLAHLYTVPFLWPRNEHKQKCRLVDDFAGQCWLWQLSSCTTLVVAPLGLPTNLGVGRSCLFPSSSIKFLTRRSLKSQWVYIAPHDDKRIQLLSTVRSRR